MTTGLMTANRDCWCGGTNDPDTDSLDQQKPMQIVPYHLDKSVHQDGLSWNKKEKEVNG